MPDTRPRLTPLAWVAAAFVVALQLYAAGRYGIFRDEFYYLMCADHPAWGYVDHPPLAMFFLTMWKSIFGDGVLALRIPPALLHGFTTVCAALVAREMRGGAAAQVLAALLVAMMPGALALGGFYSMNSFDIAFWILIAWIACRLLGDGDRRWWWGLGAAIGLGLINKYSVAFLSVGLVIGIALSPLRRELISRKALTGVAAVIAIALPHLLWQIDSGWPTLEFMHNVRTYKNVAMGPGTFWGEQLLMAHPGFTPYWIIGLAGLLLTPRLRTWRPVGIAFAVVALWLTLSHAKPYYLVPAYPMVMAAGAVLVTTWLARWPTVSRSTAIALPALALVSGLLIAPLTIPVLDVDDYVAWERTLGLRPKDMENTSTGALPQHFADRFGWEELARVVADAWAQVPEVERDRTLIYADNYGECGAVNYFGRDLGLPTAVSGHNSCFTWWPPDFEPEVVIVIGETREELEHTFAEVILAGHNDAPRAMPYEARVPVWICRGLLGSWAGFRDSTRFAI